MLSFSLLITFLILSPWLIWICFFIFYVLKYDKSFNFIILNKFQLLKYWIYILSLTFFASYIFMLGLGNIDRSINIYDITDNLFCVMHGLKLIDIIIFVLFAIWALLFIILVCKLIYLYLRKCLLALFLYYRQYEFFRECCSTYISLSLDCTLYLITRVAIFTSNKAILNLAHYIWPGFLTFLEPKIFIAILPYLFIVDFLTQDGNITKIFIILPWYYIYTLIRLSRAFFREIFIPENTEFSRAVYKSIIFNGKTLRWVEVPEI